MTFYTSGLKTHLIDPIHDSTNFQSEFRLKSDTVYLSNLRLANIGAKVNTAAPYNPLAGAAAIIKSIHLYDGNQMLDQILEFPVWAGWTSYNTPNQKNVDAQKTLARSNMGFTYSDADRPATDGSAYQPTHAKIQKHFAPLDSNTNADADTQTATAWLSLKTMLPMLDASLYLPTTVYKDLRLVIQYNTDVTQVANGARSLTSIEPLLIADEITSVDKQDSIGKSYNGVSFRAIEHDRVVVPLQNSGNAGDVQSQTYTVNGFDNKNVGRMLIVNTPSNATVIDNDDAKGLGSHSQYNQIIQLRVNGQNRFWKNGISRPNERLATLTDTWGTCNSIPGGSDIGIANATNIIHNNAALTASFDYFGAHIGDEVVELQIDYSREVSHAAQPDRYKQMLRLNLFGEVLKQISVSGSRYNIAYA